jgi:hypothetical protein
MIEGSRSVPRTNGSRFFRNTAANCGIKMSLQRLAHSHVMNVLDMGGGGEQENHSGFWGCGGGGAVFLVVDNF